MGHSKESCGANFLQTPSSSSVALRNSQDNPGVSSDINILSLPADLLEYIFARFTMEQWPSLALVCKAFHASINHIFETCSIVDLTRTALDDRQFGILLDRLPCAAHFHLDCFSLSDHSFTHIPPKTVCLELRDISKLTSASFELIADRCPSLTNLYLSTAQRTLTPLRSTVHHTYNDLGISKVLQKCTQLKHLTLDLPDPKCPVAKDLELYGTPNLTDLHLYIGGHARMSLSLPISTIQNLPLESFSLSARDIQDFGVGYGRVESFVAGLAKTFTKLEELYVDMGCYLDYCDSPSSIAAVGGLTNLRRLHLAPFQEDRSNKPGDKADEIFRMILSGCTQLEDIFVDIPVTDTTVIRLATDFGSRLRCLQLAECCELTSASLDAVARHCALLESITFFSNMPRKPGFNDASWQALLSSCGRQLYRVVVRNLSENSTFFLASSCKFVEHLVLRDCVVTNEVLISIGENMPMLGFFDVGRNRSITDDGLRDFAKACKSKFLHTLSFYKLNKITDVGIAEMAQHATGWNLEILTLNGCGARDKPLTDACLEALSRSKVKDTLLDLDVSGMQLTRSCVKSIGEFTRLRRIWGLHKFSWIGAELAALARLRVSLIVENSNQEDLI